jgi:hypothetical protein
MVWAGSTAWTQAGTARKTASKTVNGKDVENLDLRLSIEFPSPKIE